MPRYTEAEFAVMMGTYEQLLYEFEDGLRNAAMGNPEYDDEQKLDHHAAFLCAVMSFAGDCVQRLSKPEAKNAALVGFLKATGATFKLQTTEQSAAGLGKIFDVNDNHEPQRRSHGPSRTETRATVVAHTLTDTEYRYGNRNQDAQLMRKLYNGKGLKRVDVYSPTGDLLRGVEVEP